MDDAEAAREIAERGAALKRMFGVGATHFGCAFGGFNARTVDLVKHAGYRSAVTVQPGVACGRDDLHRLPRILVNGERGLGIFLLQVGTPFEDLRHGRALFPRESLSAAPAAPPHQAGERPLYGGGRRGGKAACSASPR